MELYRSRGEDPSNLGCTLLQRLIGDPEVSHVTEVTGGGQGEGVISIIWA